jgi:hypothetical protein
MYGAGLLIQSPAVVAALQPSFQMSVPYVNTSIAYLIVVVASLAFWELSLGRVRVLIEVVIFAGMLTGYSEHTAAEIITSALPTIRPE